MNQKIYFAGSIRGGRVDAALYARIIERLMQTDTVLTEHIGNPAVEQLDQGTDADIYARDTALIRQSDLLIAECTCPSLGVGYELAYAEARGIPCHVFYCSETSRLSAMIAGDPWYQVHPYACEADIWPVLDELLRD